MQIYKLDYEDGTNCGQWSETTVPELTNAGLLQRLFTIDIGYNPEHSFKDAVYEFFNRVVMLDRIRASVDVVKSIERDGCVYGFRMPVLYCAVDHWQELADYLQRLANESTMGFHLVICSY